MSEHDPVNSPSHYTQGQIQPIEAIEDWKLGFCLGNAVKYIARAGKKDPAKTTEDLKKAQWYLNREIANLSYPADEGCETIMEAIERLSSVTGYSRDDVLDTAIGLYEEVVTAKMDGMHIGATRDPKDLIIEWNNLYEGDEIEESEASLSDDFEPNEETLQAIHDVDAGIGVTRHKTAEDAIRAATQEEDESKTIYAARCAACGVHIMPGCGLEVYTGISDGSTTSIRPECHERWPHDNVLTKPAEDAIRAAMGDESKTFSDYRCHACGNPVIEEYASKAKNIFGETLYFHFGCFNESGKDAKASDKPKFAVGDKVQSAYESSSTYGIVRFIKTIDDGRLVYGVDWSEPVDSEANRFSDEHWESELKPFDAKNDRPMFAPGDKVVWVGGRRAIVHGIDGNGWLIVAWYKDMAVISPDSTTLELKD